MRIHRTFALALLVTMLAGYSHATGDADHRKVITRVEPRYPEAAKSMRLSGTVKLLATVEPNGDVKDIHVLGGGPIFVDAAVTAVRKWKYEAASQESTESVEVRFQPSE
jgi:TonB family protein